MDFFYNFDISRDIPYFNRLPENIQLSAESSVVNVIYQSFVITADQDYLMSRLLAQKGLVRGFYWAAAQAIEKYLKAFLLMNGEGVKNFKGHPLKRIFEAASRIDSSIAEINILPHQDIEVVDTLTHHLIKFRVQDFINELELHGNANNRYNLFGVKYNTGHLLAMDSFSFQVRKIIGVIPINESFRKLSDDLVMIFEKNNPWFQLKGSLNQDNIIPSEEFPIQYSDSCTHLENIQKNKGNTSYNIALKWLKKKMIIKQQKTCSASTDCT